jgi:alpha-ribazole phosphatase
VRGGIDALPAGDVLIVAHAGTIRAALALALGIEPDHALRFVIDPLSLTRLDRLENSWRVVAVNRG